MGLAGKRMIVTGAVRGIGRAISAGHVAEHAGVHVMGRSAGKLDDLPSRSAVISFSALRVSAPEAERLLSASPGERPRWR